MLILGYFKFCFYFCRGYFLAIINYVQNQSNPLS